MTTADGELPDGWAWSTVGEVALVTGGLTKNASERARSTSVVPLVTVGAVGLRDVRPNDFGQIGLLASDGERATLRRGDVLVVEGNGSLTHIGRAALWDVDIPEARHQNHLIRLRAGDLIEPRYLMEWLASPLGREALVSAATSATGLFNLSISKLEQIEIPLPPVGVQRDIVARLSALLADVREARTELDAVPRLVERLRRSVLAAAFRGDLTAAWREAHPDVEPASSLLDRIRTERRRRWAAANPKKPYVEPDPIDTNAEGLPDLPPGWCWARLGEILAEDLANGRSVPTAETGGFPVLRLTAIRNGTILVAEAKQGQWSASEAAPFLIRRGDLLVSRGNGSLHLVGRGGLVREDPPPVAYPDTMIRIRPTHLVNADFLAQLWGSPVIRDQIESRARTSAGIYKISQDILEAIAVPLPPAAEQTAVAGRVGAALEEVAAMDAIGQSTAAQLDLVERQILAKAFRGELVAGVTSDFAVGTPVQAARTEPTGTSRMRPVPPAVGP